MRRSIERIPILRQRPSNSRITVQNI